MHHNSRIWVFNVITVCSFLGISSAFVLSETPSNAKNAVQLFLTQASHGFYSSTGEKELGRTGDASAVALTKILAGKELTDADIRTAIMVVRFSFENLDGIEDTEERKPMAALFLLNSVSHMTSDPKLRADIQSTRDFAESQYAAYTKRHSIQ
jgi:hypothetical protein